MTNQRRIIASDAIGQICQNLSYSRSHVAKALRDNRRELGAKKENGRWTIPATAVERLRAIVENKSGRRYKLGERGPHGSVSIESA